MAIEDDGPGVPPEQRERIFERFVRLPDQPEVGDTGSGLGLAISRSILGLHRGTIRAVDSTRERGLRVVFEIPIADSAPEMKAPGSDVTEPPRANPAAVTTGQ